MAIKRIIKECCEKLFISVRINFHYKNVLEKYKKVVYKKLNKQYLFFEESSNIDSLINSEIESDHIIKLDAALKDQFEKAFNADFSDVKIHTGHYADKLTRKSNAAAVTIGSDIYFAGGTYSPDTEEGIKLLGHELQHIIQFQKEKRMKYPEDIASLEHEAEKTENELNNLRLHNINIPLLDMSDSPNVGQEDKTINQAESFNETSTNIWRQSNHIDDFMGRRDKPIYEIILKDGDSLLADENKIDEMYEEFKKMIIDWQREMKMCLTEKEYEKKMLKFMEIKGGLI